MTSITYPGAETPARHYHLDVTGIRLAVHEWGDEHADPLFLVHGGLDFGRTYSKFAPILARAGWRVIAWDQRGHGDSEHAALYGWDADIRDAITVMSSITSSPAPVIGHSKGGALMIQLADAHPFRFSHVVNLDGLPWKRPMADVPEHERTRMMASDLAGWLDHRRTTNTAARKAGTLEELAARRAKLNPRLPGLGMPFLGILGGQQEPMGWGTVPSQIKHMLPAAGRLELVESAGHFVHIEEPDLVSEMVIDFLGGAR